MLASSSPSSGLLNPSASYAAGGSTTNTDEVDPQLAAIFEAHFIGPAVAAQRETILKASASTTTVAAATTGAAELFRVACLHRASTRLSLRRDERFAHYHNQRGVGGGSAAGGASALNSLTSNNNNGAGTGGGGSASSNSSPPLRPSAAASTNVSPGVSPSLTGTAFPGIPPTRTSTPLGRSPTPLSSAGGGFGSGGGPVVASSFIAETELLTYCTQVWDPPVMGMGVTGSGDAANVFGGGGSASAGVGGGLTSTDASAADQQRFPRLMGFVREKMGLLLRYYQLDLCLVLLRVLLHWDLAPFIVRVVFAHNVIMGPLLKKLAEMGDRIVALQARNQAGLGAAGGTGGGAAAAAAAAAFNSDRLHSPYAVMVGVIAYCEELITVWSHFVFSQQLSNACRSAQDDAAALAMEVLTAEGAESRTYCAVSLAVIRSAIVYNRSTFFAQYCKEFFLVIWNPLSDESRALREYAAAVLREAVDALFEAGYSVDQQCAIQQVIEKGTQYVLHGNDVHAHGASMALNAVLTSMIEHGIVISPPTAVMSPLAVASMPNVLSPPPPPPNSHGDAGSAAAPFALSPTNMSSGGIPSSFAATAIPPVSRHHPRTSSAHANTVTSAATSTAQQLFPYERYKALCQYLVTRQPNWGPMRQLALTLLPALASFNTEAFRSLYFTAACHAIEGMSGGGAGADTAGTGGGNQASSSSSSSPAAANERQTTNTDRGQLLLARVELIRVLGYNETYVFIGNRERLEKPLMRLLQGATPDMPQEDNRPRVDIVVAVFVRLLKYCTPGDLQVAIRFAVDVLREAFSQEAKTRSFVFEFAGEGLVELATRYRELYDIIEHSLLRGARLVVSARVAAPAGVLAGVGQVPIISQHLPVASAARQSPGTDSRPFLPFVPDGGSSSGRDDGAFSDTSSFHSAPGTPRSSASGHGGGGGGGGPGSVSSGMSYFAHNLPPVFYTGGGGASSMSSESPNPNAASSSSVVLITSELTRVAYFNVLRVFPFMDPTLLLLFADRFLVDFLVSTDVVLRIHALRTIVAGLQSALPFISRDRSTTATLGHVGSERRSTSPQPLTPSVNAAAIDAVNATTALAHISSTDVVYAASRRAVDMILAVAVGDRVSVVRREALNALAQCSVEGYLATINAVASLSAALNDQHIENRIAALRLLQRVAPLVPALVSPPLRRLMLSLLSDSGSSVAGYGVLVAAAASNHGGVALGALGANNSKAIMSSYSPSQLLLATTSSAPLSSRQLEFRLIMIEAVVSTAPKFVVLHTSRILRWMEVILSAHEFLSHYHHPYHGHSNGLFSSSAPSSVSLHPMSGPTSPASPFFATSGGSNGGGPSFETGAATPLGPVPSSAAAASSRESTFIRLHGSFVYPSSVGSGAVGGIGFAARAPAGTPGSILPQLPLALVVTPRIRCIAISVVRLLAKDATDDELASTFKPLFVRAATVVVVSDDAQEVASALLCVEYMIVRGSSLGFRDSLKLSHPNFLESLHRVLATQSLPDDAKLAAVKLIGSVSIAFASEQPAPELFSRVHGTNRVGLGGEGMEGEFASIRAVGLGGTAASASSHQVISLSAAMSPTIPRNSSNVSQLLGRRGLLGGGTLSHNASALDVAGMGAPVASGNMTMAHSATDLTAAVVAPNPAPAAHHRLRSGSGSAGPRDLSSSSPFTSSITPGPTAGGRQVAQASQPQLVDLDPAAYSSFVLATLVPILEDAKAASMHRTVLTAITDVLKGHSENSERAEVLSVSKRLLDVIIELLPRGAHHRSMVFRFIAVPANLEKLTPFIDGIFLDSLLGSMSAYWFESDVDTCLNMIQTFVPVVSSAQLRDRCHRDRIATLISQMFLSLQKCTETANVIPEHRNFLEYLLDAVVAASPWLPDHLVAAFVSPVCQIAVNIALPLSSRAMAMAALFKFITTLNDISSAQTLIIDTCSSILRPTSSAALGKGGSSRQLYTSPAPVAASPVADRTGPFLSARLGAGATQSRAAAGVGGPIHSVRRWQGNDVGSDYNILYDTSLERLGFASTNPADLADVSVLDIETVAVLCLLPNRWGKPAIAALSVAIVPSQHFEKTVQVERIRRLLRSRFPQCFVDFFNMCVDIGIPNDNPELGNASTSVKFTTKSSYSASSAPPVPPEDDGSGRRMWGMSEPRRVTETLPAAAAKLRRLTTQESVEEENEEKAAAAAAASGIPNLSVSPPSRMMFIPPQQQQHRIIPAASRSGASSTVHGHAATGSSSNGPTPVGEIADAAANSGGQFTSSSLPFTAAPLSGGFLSDPALQGTTGSGVGGSLRTEVPPLPGTVGSLRGTLSGGGMASRPTFILNNNGSIAFDNPQQLRSHQAWLRCEEMFSAGGGSAEQWKMWFAMSASNLLAECPIQSLVACKDIVSTHFGTLLTMFPYIFVAAMSNPPLDVHASIFINEFHIIKDLVSRGDCTAPCELISSIALAADRCFVFRSRISGSWVLPRSVIVTLAVQSGAMALALQHAEAQFMECTSGVLHDERSASLERTGGGGVPEGSGDNILPFIPLLSPKPHRTRGASGHSNLPSQGAAVATSSAQPFFPTVAHAASLIHRLRDVVTLYYALYLPTPRPVRSQLRGIADNLKRVFRQESGCFISAEDLDITLQVCALLERIDEPNGAVDLLLHMFRAMARPLVGASGGGGGHHAADWTMGGVTMLDLNDTSFDLGGGGGPASHNIVDQATNHQGGGNKWLRLSLDPSVNPQPAPVPTGAGNSTTATEQRPELRRGSHIAGGTAGATTGGGSGAAPALHDEPVFDISLPAELLAALLRGLNCAGRFHEVVDLFRDVRSRTDYSNQQRAAFQRLHQQQQPTGNRRGSTSGGGATQTTMGRVSGVTSAGPSIAPTPHAGRPSLGSMAARRTLILEPPNNTDGVTAAAAIGSSLPPMTAAASQPPPPLVRWGAGGSGHPSPSTANLNPGGLAVDSSAVGNDLWRHSLEMQCGRACLALGDWTPLEDDWNKMAATGLDRATLASFDMIQCVSTAVMAVGKGNATAALRIIAAGRQSALRRTAAMYREDLRRAYAISLCVQAFSEIEEGLAATRDASSLSSRLFLSNLDRRVGLSISASEQLFDGRTIRSLFVPESRQPRMALQLSYALRSKGDIIGALAVMGPVLDDVQDRIERTLMARQRSTPLSAMGASTTTAPPIMGNGGSSDVSHSVGGGAIQPAAQQQILPITTAERSCVIESFQIDMTLNGTAQAVASLKRLDQRLQEYVGGPAVRVWPVLDPVSHHVLPKSPHHNNSNASGASRNALELSDPRMSPFRAGASVLRSRLLAMEATWSTASYETHGIDLFLHQAIDLAKDAHLLAPSRGSSALLVQLHLQVANRMAASLSPLMPAPVASTALAPSPAFPTPTDYLLGAVRNIVRAVQLDGFGAAGGNNGTSAAAAAVFDRRDELIGEPLFCSGTMNPLALLLALLHITARLPWSSVDQRCADGLPQSYWMRLTAVLIQLHAGHQDHPLAGSILLQLAKSSPEAGAIARELAAHSDLPAIANIIREASAASSVFAAEMARATALRSLLLSRRALQLDVSSQGLSVPSQITISAALPEDFSESDSDGSVWNQLSAEQHLSIVMLGLIPAEGNATTFNGAVGGGNDARSAVASPQPEGGGAISTVTSSAPPHTQTPPNEEASPPATPRGAQKSTPLKRNEGFEPFLTTPVVKPKKTPDAAMTPPALDRSGGAGLTDDDELTGSLNGGAAQTTHGGTIIPASQLVGGATYFIATLVCSDGQRHNFELTLTNHEAAHAAARSIYLRTAAVAPLLRNLCNVISTTSPTFCGGPVAARRPPLLRPLAVVPIAIHLGHDIGGAIPPFDSAGASSASFGCPPAQVAAFPSEVLFGGGSGGHGTPTKVPSPSYVPPPAARGYPILPAPPPQQQQRSSHHQNRNQQTMGRVTAAATAGSHSAGAPTASAGQQPHCPATVAILVPMMSDATASLHLLSTGRPSKAFQLRSVDRATFVTSAAAVAGPGGGFSMHMSSSPTVSPRSGPLGGTGGLPPQHRADRERRVSMLLGSAEFEPLPPAMPKSPHTAAMPPPVPVAGRRGSLARTASFHSQAASGTATPPAVNGSGTAALDAPSVPVRVAALHDLWNINQGRDPLAQAFMELAPDASSWQRARSLYAQTLAVWSALQSVLWGGPSRFPDTIHVDVVTGEVLIGDIFAFFSAITDPLSQHPSSSRSGSRAGTPRHRGGALSGGAASSSSMIVSPWTSAPKMSLWQKLPFRLTKALLNALELKSAHGTFAETMNDALRALSQRRACLAPVADAVAWLIYGIQGRPNDAFTSFFSHLPSAEVKRANGVHRAVPSQGLTVEALRFGQRLRDIPMPRYVTRQLPQLTSVLDVCRAAPDTTAAGNASSYDGSESPTGSGEPTGGLDVSSVTAPPRLPGGADGGISPLTRGQVTRPMSRVHSVGDVAVSSESEGSPTNSHTRPRTLDTPPDGPSSTGNTLISPSRMIIPAFPPAISSAIPIAINIIPPQSSASSHTGIAVGGAGSGAAPGMSPTSLGLLPVNASFGPAPVGSAPTQTASLEGSFSRLNPMKVPTTEGSTSAQPQPQPQRQDDNEEDSVIRGRKVQGGGRGVSTTQRAAIMIQRHVRGYLVRSQRGIGNGIFLAQHVALLINAATCPSNLVIAPDVVSWAPHW